MIFSNCYFWISQVINSVKTDTIEFPEWKLGEFFCVKRSTMPHFGVASFHLCILRQKIWMQKWISMWWNHSKQFINFQKTVNFDKHFLKHSKMKSIYFQTIDSWMISKPFYFQTPSFSGLKTAVSRKCSNIWVEANFRF